MPEISRLFYLLAFIFLILGLVVNISPHFPRLPGDIYIDRPGLKVYIPFTSAIIISVVLSILLNFFKK